MLVGGVPPHQRLPSCQLASGPFPIELPTLQPFPLETSRVPRLFSPGSSSREGLPFPTARAPIAKAPNVDRGREDASSSPVHSSESSLLTHQQTLFSTLHSSSTFANAIDSKNFALHHYGLQASSALTEACSTTRRPPCLTQTATTVDQPTSPGV